MVLWATRCARLGRLIKSKIMNENLKNEKFDKAYKIIDYLCSKKLYYYSIFNSQDYINKIENIAKDFFNDDIDKTYLLFFVSDSILTGMEQPKSIDDLVEIFKNYFGIVGEPVRALASRYWVDILSYVYDDAIKVWEMKDKILKELEIKELKEEKEEILEEAEEVKEEKEIQEVPQVINLKEYPKKEYEVETAFPEQKEIDWDKIKEEIKKEEVKKIEIEEKKDLSQM